MEFLLYLGAHVSGWIFLPPNCPKHLPADVLELTPIRKSQRQGQFDQKTLFFTVKTDVKKLNPKSKHGTELTFCPITDLFQLSTHKTRVSGVQKKSVQKQLSNFRCKKWLKMNKKLTDISSINQICHHSYAVCLFLC